MHSLQREGHWKFEVNLVWILCSSRTYPDSPYRRDRNNSQGVGEGSVGLKNSKKCMKLAWNFQRGGEVLKKSLPWGGMDIF